MDALKLWHLEGGAPPWPEIRCGDVEALLSESSLEFLEGIPRCSSTFSWPDYEALDARWMKFDMVHRLALAGDMLGLPGFDVVKKSAESVYAAIAQQASRSRVLTAKMKALAKVASLKKWQKNTVETCFWGSQAYVKAEERTRAANRLAQLERLERTCESNVRESIVASPVWTRDRAHLAGLPLWLVDEARARAKERGWSGWLFLSHYRDYRRFMATAESREMRRLMYNSRSRAGSEFVPGCDNAMLAKKILRLRKSEAVEAGHKNYASYILAGRMVEAPLQVEGMLLSVAQDATLAATSERMDVDAWMKAKHGVARLEPWDYRFARAALLREASCGALSAAEKYFTPIGTIERSVQAVAAFLGVVVKRARCKEVDDLMVFNVSLNGALHGALTIIPQLREGDDDNVAFEWMLGVRARCSGAMSSSMVFLQLPATASRLHNLTHPDVVNLFHELGHAFHSILGSGRHSGDGPAAIEGDAMEFHSQLVEQLAWEPKVMRAVGRHKGRPMGARMAGDLCALRNFHAGAWTISQVTDALCDLRLHTEFKPKGKLLPWEVMVAIKSEIGLDRPKSYNRQAQQLGTFTGSYVCSDYCYLWSEGMARKAFEKWRLDCAGRAGSAAAGRRLRSAFFEKGSTSSMMRQIHAYVGETPNATWVAISRGFL